MKKFLKYIILPVLLIFLLLAGFFMYINYIFNNDFKDLTYKEFKIEKIDGNTTHIGNNWLRQERPGLYTLYVEGKPFERGLIAGQLTRTLIYRQEKAFVDQIHRMVPSDAYLSLLKYIIGLFDFNLYHSIPVENRKEIYGISFSASQNFATIGSNYQRILNYHGAHDLGHMLNNLGMVGCTSFGVWNSRTRDGNLLVGRNFDFYVGDDFSKEKIVEFVRPDSGYCHAFITWGGMIGAVSGMNQKGLTVTINAANSDVRIKGATPVSIVARQILQYASTIEEATLIASKFDIFVSELFLIGSATDNKAVIIEKRPGSQQVFDPSADNIISTNHFQSRQNGYLPSSMNQRFNTASGYRYERVKEHLNMQRTFIPSDIAGILRDTYGLDGANIGIGNEDAINQLIAHHSIIFCPARKIFWISTSPYQLGEYVAYDLNEVFSTGIPGSGISRYKKDSINIKPDFVFIAEKYPDYEHYKSLRQKGIENTLTEKSIDSLVILNPDSYEAYEMTGDYYLKTKRSIQAKQYYGKALSCVIPGSKERDRLRKKQKKCVD